MTIHAIESDFRPGAVGATTAQFIDRWIYVFMAGLFLATTLVGFIPDSIEMLAVVRAGQRPPLPAVLHVHAVLMGLWLLLLLAQTSLMATGRRASHQKLGIVSFALMPAMVVTGLVLVPTMLRQIWSVDTSVLPPPVAADIAQTKIIVTNIMLFQIRVGFVFPLLVVWALMVRRKDPETHKRLMILASVLPLPAAIDRIPWLPTTLPESPFAVDVYMLLFILPMLIVDVVRLRRVPRAYLIWAGVGLPFAIALNVLWGTPWWLATGPKLVGLSGL
jgi:hypothetical protein